jgi:hypothetical protein
LEYLSVYRLGYGLDGEETVALNQLNAEVTLSIGFNTVIVKMNKIACVLFANNIYNKTYMTSTQWLFRVTQN